MELSSNTQTNNVISSLFLTHFLNLTQPKTGNVTSWLSTSTLATAITRNSLIGITSGAMLLIQSSNQTRQGMKSDRRRGRTDNSEVEFLETFNKYFTTVIDPVVIATGIVGNALLAIVFIITQLRLQPLSHILSGLGVVDLVYMLSYMLMYLTKHGVNVYGVPGACQILNFTLMLSKCMQAWYILMSHLNRLKAHTSTGSEKRIFPTKFAIVLIGVLIAAPLLHILWSMETVTIASTTYCVPMRETIFVHLALRKIEMIGTVLIPLVLITGVDCVLLLKLITHYVTKDNSQEDNKKEKTISAISTSSSIDKNVLKLQQKEDNSKEKQIDESIDNNLLEADKDFRLAFQIAYNLVKETSSTHHYESCVETVPTSSQDLSLATHTKTLRNLPRIISTNDSQTDNNITRLSTQVSEPHPDTTEKSFSNLDSSSNNEKRNTTEPTSCNNIQNEVLISKTESVIDLYTNYSESNIKRLRKESSEQDERDIICNSNNSTSGDSKNWTKAKFIVPVFVLNGLKKCKLSPGVGFSKENACKQDFIKNSNSRANSNTTSNNTQCGRYECASQISILPRTHATREEDALPNDSTSSTIATVILGLVFALTILPSTYTHALRLFSDSPTSRPTASSIQTAILFESFVQINASYKLFMYALVMPSFRSAVMWLLNHWIRNKISRISSICVWGSQAKKTEMVYV